jgi:hypothetical protein
MERLTIPHDGRLIAATTAVVILGITLTLALILLLGKAAW